MTLEQAIALLTDILANHKDDRSRIQKELGNLRLDGFEVKVMLNAKTTALVKDAERLLTKLTAVKAMQTIAFVQMETHSVEDAPQVVEAVPLEVIEEAVVEIAEPLQLDETEALSVALMEAAAEVVLAPVNTHLSGVSFDAKAVQLETKTGALFEQVEPLQSELVPSSSEAALRGDTKVVGETAENLPPAFFVDVVEGNAKTPFTRKSLTEIMAQPDRPSTEEEEREFALLEQLFTPKTKTSNATDSGETKLPDVQSPSALLSSQSQAIQTAKSFESIVIVLVVIVLVFKAIITIIKAIEESEIAIAQAKNFEQMYTVVGQKVRRRVKGFAVA